MKNLLTTIAMLLIVTTLSFAGVKMEFSSYESNEQDKAITNNIIFSNDKMKVENNDSEEGKMSVIFDANKEKLVILKHDEKKFLVISKEMIENLKKQMESMKENMKQQLANLPDAQRKQMEKMMEERMGGKNIEYDVEKTNDSKSINSWNTTKYNLKQDDNIVDEVWVAPMENTGFTKSDFEIMNKFGKFSSELMKINPKAKKNTFSVIYEKIQGIPIMTIDNTTKKVNELKKLEHYNASDSDFDIPNDYTEEKLPMPGMNK